MGSSEPPRRKVLQFRLIIIYGLGSAIAASLIIRGINKILVNAYLSWIIGFLLFAVLAYFILVRKGGLVYREAERLILPEAQKVPSQAVHGVSGEGMDFAGSLATGSNDCCFPHKKSAKSPFKKILYYLTIPANVLSDIGFMALRFRKIRFFRKLRQHKNSIPLISGSGFLMSRLTFLGLEDVEALIQILNGGIDSPVTFSGHYLYVGKREIPLPATLSTANLAVEDILGCIIKDHLSAGALAKELQILNRICQHELGVEDNCPFCYK